MAAGDSENEAWKRMTVGKPGVWPRKRLPGCWASVNGRFGGQ